MPNERDSRVSVPMNGSVIDSSAAQHQFRFDFTLGWTSSEQNLNDVQMDNYRSSLMVMAFDRHLQIHEVNATLGTSTLEVLNLT